MLRKLPGEKVRLKLGRVEGGVSENEEAGNQVDCISSTVSGPGSFEQKVKEYLEKLESCSEAVCYIRLKS